MDVSLIVVSRNRTSDLVRLCDVLKHQFGLVFQLIIVTNSDQEIVKSALGSFPATVVCMDVANISMMRNAGLAQALGRVIAFCDDDCIPEPDWLARLIQPLLDGLADAATGAVFGRNGCTPQWDMVWSGRDGLDLHSDPLPQDTQYFSGTADRFVKLQGTNFAVLKAKLDALGGFDPAYAYYLDDTDLSLRLAQNGARIAFVPEARVHHLFEANQTRFRSRAPRSLSVIGASVRYFADQHSADPEAAISKHKQLQWHRALDALTLGRLEPRDIKPLMNSFDQEAVEITPANPEVIAKADRPFADNQGPPKGVLVVSSWTRAAQAIEICGSRTKTGELVTLLVLDPSARPHMRNYESGIYTQDGGRFGRLNRRRRRSSGGQDVIARVTADIGGHRNILETVFI